MNNKKNGLTNLTEKIATIFGVAFVTLIGVKANSTVTQIDNLSSKVIETNHFGRVKPMPVLKLNASNPEDSQFVASHASHASHSSHYSHSSGALFS